MKTSAWLYLASACLVILGLFIAWPFLLCGAVTSSVGWVQRRKERAVALRASTVWPRP